MIVERIIFNVVAFALFFIIFSKMIQKNDTSYTSVLIIQALGIAISFISLIFRIDMPIAVIIFTYILSILLPFAIVISERKGISLSEIISINMAKINERKNDNEKAKEILMKMLEKYPNSYFIHKELAKLCENTGNIDLAIDEYIRSSELNKKDYNMQLKTAELLKNTTRSQDAVRILNDLLKVKPDCCEASCILGDILYENENYMEAINVYLQALNYNPDKYELYYNLGMIYTRLNDFQNAKEYYEKAAELNSILYKAKYNLGQIALLYNELDEAEEKFMQATQDDELVDEAYYYLAYVSMLKGDKEKGIQYLNIAVEDNKKLYNKANKELIFKIIMNKIKKPTSNTEGKEKRRLTKKELETIKHLEKTCEVVGNLNQNDIKVMRMLKRKEKEIGRERE